MRTKFRFRLLMLVIAFGLSAASGFVYSFIDGDLMSWECGIDSPDQDDDDDSQYVIPFGNEFRSDRRCEITAFLTLFQSSISISFNSKSIRAPPSIN